MLSKQDFNARALLDTFNECLRTLEHLGDRNEHRVKKLEELCKTQEKEQNGRLGNLDRLYQVRNYLAVSLAAVRGINIFHIVICKDSFADFEALENRITLVATKVVYLGDQLESTNSKRGKAEEARDILLYLNEFRNKHSSSADIFKEANKV